MEDDLIFKEIQYNRIRVHLEIGQRRRVYITNYIKKCSQHNNYKLSSFTDISAGNFILVYLSVCSSDKTDIHKQILIIRHQKPYNDMSKMNYLFETTKLGMYKTQ